MHTLLDVTSSVRRQNEVRAPEGWPIGLPPKQRLRVPDLGELVLPKQADGLNAWLDDRHNGSVPLPAELVIEARSALLSRPSFLAPLPVPGPEWFARQGIDQSTWRRETPASILSAVAFGTGSGTVFGIGRTMVVEHSRGFGSSDLLHHEESWWQNFDEFADALSEQVIDANLRPQPEGDAAPWTTVMMLLNEEALEPGLPSGWRRDLELVAGLYAVNLVIHSNAWSKKARILHELRSGPPNALLIADGSITAPDVFMGPYLRARPTGYGQLLATKDGINFREQILELGLHLREVSHVGTSTAETNESEEAPIDWEEGAKLVKQLQGDHFKLSERALGMLKNNPYPDPRRMYKQVAALAAIARKYHENAGNLGRRLEDEAILGHGIEIALFDSKTSANQVESFGRNYEAIAHVKVDDGTTADKCGRIYFAMDDHQYVFIVDHIGLHNYG